MSNKHGKQAQAQALEPVKEEGALVVHDYSEYAGQGFESHTREDYAVPFLGVLQSNSPQIDTLPEARPGNLINTVTNMLYPKDGVAFIPAETQHVFVEWKPRDLGGGFVKVRELNDPLILKAKEEQEFGKYKTIKGDKNSNDLVETFYIYGILVNADGTSEQTILAFTSTKIKVYKKWMTQARTIQIPLPDGRRINPPLFAHRYRVTAASEKNAKGTFYNFQVKFDGKDAGECRLSPKDPLFQEAKAFFDLIRQGNVKAAHETQTSATADAEAEGATPFK